MFLFGCLFVISYSYFSFSYNFSACFVCFIFAFYFGLAYFSLLVSFVLSSFLRFLPSVADELSCSVAFPDCGMLRTLVISGVNTFTAIVDLSRSNFSIARAPLFQLKSAT